MKKVIAIFIFFVLTLCTAGFFIAWHISLQNIRISQKSAILQIGIHKDRIVKFVISKDKLNQENQFSFNGDNELQYQGQMYDVIDKTTIGDSIVINCISDKKEDELIQLVFSELVNKNDNSTGKELPIFKLKLDHFNNQSSYFFPVNITNNQHNFFLPPDHVLLPQPFLNVSSPPPWIFS